MLHVGLPIGTGGGKKGAALLRDERLEVARNVDGPFGLLKKAA